MSGGSAYLRVDGRKLQGGSQKGQDLLAGLYILEYLLTRSVHYAIISFSALIFGVKNMAHACTEFVGG